MMLFAGSAEHLPIPTSSHRRSAENAGVECQLPQSWIPVPGDLFELGGFISKPLGLLVGPKAHNLLDAHDAGSIDQSMTIQKK